MRNSFAHRGGFVLTRTLSERERASRRRVGVIAAVLALAIGSGLIGVMSNPASQAVGKVYTSPLSYISVQ